MHIGQTEIAALVAIREAFVVEAEQVEQRGVEVVDVHGVFGDLVTEVVGCAVGDPGFHAAAGHPNGERVLVVVASKFGGRAGAGIGLRHRRAAEFAAPDHECIFEETTLFQILHERGHAAVHVLAFAGQARGEVAVVIPVRVVELHHAHAALNEPAGEQTVVSKRGFTRFRAVEFQRRA